MFTRNLVLIAISEVCHKLYPIMRIVLFRIAATLCLLSWACSCVTKRSVLQPKAYGDRYVTGQAQTFTRQSVGGKLLTFVAFSGASAGMIYPATIRRNVWTELSSLVGLGVFGLGFSTLFKVRPWSMSIPPEQELKKWQDTYNKSASNKIVAISCPSDNGRAFQFERNVVAADVKYINVPLQLLQYEVDAVKLRFYDGTLDKAIDLPANLSFNSYQTYSRKSLPYVFRYRPAEVAGTSIGRGQFRLAGDSCIHAFYEGSLHKGMPNGYGHLVTFDSPAFTYRGPFRDGQMPHFTQLIFKLALGLTVNTNLNRYGMIWKNPRIEINKVSINMDEIDSTLTNDIAISGKWHMVNLSGKQDYFLFDFKSDDFFPFTGKASIYSVPAGYDIRGNDGYLDDNRSMYDKFLESVGIARADSLIKWGVNSFLDRGQDELLHDHLKINKGGDEYKRYCNTRYEQDREYDGSLTETRITEMANCYSHRITFYNRATKGDKWVQVANYRIEQKGSCNQGQSPDYYLEGKRYTSLSEPWTVLVQRMRLKYPPVSDDNSLTREEALAKRQQAFLEELKFATKRDSLLARFKNTARFRASGLNPMIGVWHDPDNEQLILISANGDDNYIIPLTKQHLSQPYDDFLVRFNLTMIEGPTIKFIFEPTQPTLKRYNSLRPADAAFEVRSIGQNAISFSDGSLWKRQ